MERSKITREQLIEDLRKSDQFHRTLLESSPDAVVVTDLDGRAIYASRRTAEIFGFSTVDELLGKNPLEFMVPNDLPRMFADLQHTADGGASKKVEYNFVRVDGSPFLGEVSGAVIRDDSGCPVAMMGLMRDVSDRKKADDAVQRERRALQRLLRSSDHERQLIAYEIHDGLAQQLAGAIMQFETYRERAGAMSESSAEAFQAAMTTLYQANIEARRLISGVRPPILDQSGVMAAIALLIHEQEQLHGAKIEFQSSVDFHRLAPTQENAVYRIVQESLSNACRHSRSSRIAVNVIQHDRRLRITVRDWGIGFDVENVDGERFGLEGIRERSRLLGGEAVIESQPGQGTRVWVTKRLGGDETPAI